MKNKEKIVQLCFSISGLSTFLGQLSVTKIVNIKRMKRIKKARNDCIKELVKILQL